MTILVSGPTASGKSALALALAQRRAARGGALIINADALQVFGGWRVLTARPPAEDEAAAPHALYGHVPAHERYSTGRWLREVAPLLDACRADGRTPILVGGTGLYFKALTEGLAEIPEPSPALRAAMEARLAAEGLPAFADALRAADPETAARIDLRNPRRVLRAWEVLEGEGRGLAAFHDATPPPLVPLAQALPIRLTPDRERLYAACDARFDAMLESGALEEAAEMARRDPPPSAQAMQALGARELVAHARGELTLDEARAQATMVTRNYAKRQLTWTRNQMTGWRSFENGAEALAALTAEGLA
ncbi:tRNA (adenosine(37)-N6)-dimethylallyltransferase MiaA [Rhodovulum sp. DZ06]|uniref:tRNA (adenosine(37)-N6)-dimethylallyltransferase MiaA n=1 Tax=Rhodovulum sp. DZ06 TaxID=3425126 RepID=UPI003D32B31D